MRGVAKPGRLIVVFQPYRLYRTNAFLAEIADALRLADEVVVMEVYCPGEERGPGEGGAALARAIAAAAETAGQQIDVVFEPSWSAVPDLVAARARPGDLVLTMGAPPIVMMGEEILAACAKADSDE